MPGDDYTSKRLTIAQKGINYELEPTLMKGMFSPYMKNMLIDKGRARKFLGYTDLGRGNLNGMEQDGSTVPSGGHGLALKQYVSPEGYRRTYAFTERLAFYALGSSDPPLWNCVNPGESVEACSTGWTDAHADFTVTHASDSEMSANVLKMAAGSTFSDADKIAYKNFASADLSDYTHIFGWIKKDQSNPTVGAYQPTLVISESADGAKAGSYIEIELPFGYASTDKWQSFCIEIDLSDLDAAVSIGVWNNSDITWTNGQNIYLAGVQAITLIESSRLYPNVSFAETHDETTFADGDAEGLIVSLGPAGNYPLIYTIGGARFQELVTGVNLSWVNTVIEFWNHFFIGGYAGSGVNARSTIGHAALGDVDDWTSDGSGFYTLTDANGNILALTKNDYMMNIYSERSISRGLWYGSYILFTFPCIMQKLGLLGCRAVVQSAHGDYFIGSDQNFYFMQIGQKPQQIGKQVTPYVFDEVAYMKYPSIFCMGNFESMDRILFGIPHSALQPTKFLVYNKRIDGWEYLEFSHSVGGFENIILENTSVSPYYRTAFCFIDKSGNVFEINEPATGKMGVHDIACEYQTEDVTIDDEHSNARWKWFTFTAKSSIADSTVVVQYSIDNGSTWTAFDDSPVSLTSSWVTHRIPLDVVSRVIRFRFTQTAGDLQIKANMFYGFSPDTEE